MGEPASRTRPPGSVSRPFVLLILSTFLGMIAFLAWFVTSHLAVHERTTRLSRNLEQTIDLNLQLRSGMDEQLRLLQRYTETMDPRLQAGFSELNFELSDAQIHYLTLDIDIEERLVTRRSSMSMSRVR